MFFIIRRSWKERLIINSAAVHKTFAKLAKCQRRRDLSIEKQKRATLIKKLMKQYKASGTCCLRIHYRIPVFYKTTKLWLVGCLIITKYTQLGKKLLVWKLLMNASPSFTVNYTAAERSILKKGIHLHIGVSRSKELYTTAGCLSPCCQGQDDNHDASFVRPKSRWFRMTHTHSGSCLPSLLYRTRMYPFSSLPIHKMHMLHFLAKIPKEREKHLFRKS